MALSANEAALVQAIWAKASSQTNELGAEALERLFNCFPQTKTYFSHFDISHGSPDLLNHGGKVLQALGNAANHLDDIAGALSTLSDLHAYNLRVDPGNFNMLSHTIQVVLAAHFKADFTPEAHAAWDKFITLVSTVLTSKYR